MKYKIATIFTLLSVMVIGLTSWTYPTKQENKEMDLAGFIFKIPSGVSIGKTTSGYVDEQEVTTWTLDSIEFHFEVWKKEDGISTAKDLYAYCQYFCSRSGGYGYINDDYPTRTDYTIFALGKGLDETSHNTEFRMVIDYPNSPNLILIESSFNDKNTLLVNEIIRHNLKTYTYKGELLENNNLYEFLKENTGNYNFIENESVKQRINRFAGKRIYHLILAHAEKITSIEQINCNGNAFYEWTAFDDYARIVILYNVVTDHLQILIEEDGDKRLYFEDPNEYSPFKNLPKD